MDFVRRGSNPLGVALSFFLCGTTGVVFWFFLDLCAYLAPMMNGRTGTTTPALDLWVSLWPNWIRRLTTNQEIGGSSPSRDIFLLSCPGWQTYPPRHAAKTGSCVGNKIKKIAGAVRESNPRPLAPEARIIPLDQRPVSAGVKSVVRDDACAVTLSGEHDMLCVQAGPLV